ncbi:hypothetical protein ONZ45_g7375 [Pleurotus djamor]|nr:hypothetical protein ONZ45_g7375 [Pleurotus djamor]
MDSQEINFIGDLFSNLGLGRPSDEALDEFAALTNYDAETLSFDSHKPMKEPEYPSWNIAHIFQFAAPRPQRALKPVVNDLQYLVSLWDAEDSIWSDDDDDDGEPAISELDASSEDGSQAWDVIEEESLCGVTEEDWVVVDEAIDKAP